MGYDKQSDESPSFSHFLCAAGGAIAGAWWVNNQIDESKRSRAEIDDPGLVEEVCNKVGRWLDSWEPQDYESEDGFVDDLADWIEEHTDWEVEVHPSTSEGRPDILVADALALELKLNPSKTERDRCIGQCAGYSREWVTWIVVVGSRASAVGRMEQVLADKGLDRIPVWRFVG